MVVIVIVIHDTGSRSLPAYTILVMITILCMIIVVVIQRLLMLVKAITLIMIRSLPLPTRQ